MTNQRDREAEKRKYYCCEAHFRINAFIPGCAHVRSEPEASDEQRAERLARLCERCGFDTSCCYGEDDLFKLIENQVALMRELHAERLAQALADARREEREAGVLAVMDLLTTIRSIGGTVAEKDLVKLAKRIRARGSKP